MSLYPEYVVLFPFNTLVPVGRKNITTTFVLNVTLFLPGDLAKCLFVCLFF